MDGMHDLGDKQGFGRVKYPSAPHNEGWRPLVRALQAFAIKTHICNIDEFRHAIERMTPRHYISAPSHVAAAAAVKNQSAEVSHSPSRIENKRLPATGSTQGANLVDRTINTLAMTAP